jgi:glutamyl-tRNA synthetase
MPISESDPPTRDHIVVGRLAPSPTGAQHLGNARTYLIAWLAARAAGGRVVLRIEDIDSPRVKPWAIEQAIIDLKWLGLDWDEGPDIGGPHAPYLQTQRVETYDAALARLIDAGLAYPCTCTRKDIESASSAPHESVAHQQSLHQPLASDPRDSIPHLFMDGPNYSGQCAKWQLGDPLPDEGTYCWRFRSPNQTLVVIDRCCGPLQLNPAKDLGDFPLTRKNGHAAYQLAVVVDDDAMQVNQVVRGDDLIPSIFRQVPLIDALGLPRPQYCHLPLVVGIDGRRLAKRHGDTRLSQYRDAGVSPESIIGWAAHSIGLTDTDQPIRPIDLIGRFDWSRIVRTEAVVSDPHFLN